MLVIKGYVDKYIYIYFSGLNNRAKFTLTVRNPNLFY